jgi:putative ABC transport system substrate-binding protein
MVSRAEDVSMRRRQFIKLAGGVAIALSSGAHAQNRRPIPVVGLVSIGASSSNAANFGPFLEQMQELGYADGRNVRFDRRFADGRDELIREYVADLVRLAVDIIVVTGTRESLAAKQATSTIPIVTIVAPDPVGMGLAQSLARPGGNVTGLTTMDLDIYGKRMALLKGVVPDLKKIGVLVSPGKPEYNRASEWGRRITGDAHSLGVAIDIVEADESNFDSVLSRLRADGARGLVVTSDGIFVAHRKLLAESAIKNRLPAIFSYKQQAEAGGLLAYAARVADLSRRAAFFVDRILKGAKPADLPIERPSRFEFVVNRKTAAALDLDVSAAILAQADEVIE